MALLSNQVPDDTALTTAGSATVRVLSPLVPVVGGTVGEVFSIAMEERAARRQRDFNTKVAGAIDAMQERIGLSLTVESLTSDEFLAAFTRASRLASETSSEGKRQRLAASLAGGLIPGSIALSDRDRLTRAIEELDDIHVWLLHYFSDPKGWLDAHGLQATYERTLGGGILGPLHAALAQSGATADSALERAIGDVQRHGLLNGFALRSMMTGSGTVEPRITPLGRQFLAYLSEPASQLASPPPSGDWVPPN